MTHDYKRNGTTDLFGALNVATGQVRLDCRNTHADALRFFKLIDLHVAKHLDIHVVLATWPPTKRRRSRPGWLIPSGPGGTCTSSRPAQAG